MAESGEKEKKPEQPDSIWQIKKGLKALPLFDRFLGRFFLLIRKLREKSPPKDSGL